MIKTLKNFHIGQIAASGQCFRMEEAAPDLYRVMAGEHYLEIRVLETSGPPPDLSSAPFQTCNFSCSEEEFSCFWHTYFDLGLDYSTIKGTIPETDTYLTKAASDGWGIRILRQDLWETIVSFLISQQNNIPRIRRCIRLLCEAYGTPPETGGAPLFSFPGPEALASASEEALRACNLGYRAKYILRTARAVCDGTVDLEKIKKLNYSEAREALLACYGVGVKVADCICLFALHKTEAFPVDTHIRQVLDREYPGGFPLGPHAGIFQQYLFYRELIGA